MSNNKTSQSREVLISVDIEASGPIPGRYSMLALGACVVDAPYMKFYGELKPISDAAVYEAMAVVKRTIKDFKKTGEAPIKVMRGFSQWILRVCKGRKPVFLGFNATFDWAFVNWYFHTYLGKNPFGFGGVDIKSYYMGLSNCSWEDTRSSRLPKTVIKGVLPHSHNALDDAIEQAQIFKAIRALSRRRRTDLKV